MGQLSGTPGASAQPGSAGARKSVRKEAPTSLIVGANDGPLPQAMRDIQALIAGAVLEVIPEAGHLPNIDQPQVFNAALLQHFDRVAGGR